jgi:PIN domain nuclease of toxin-antitoxin system
VSRFLLDTHVWLWLLAEPDRIDGSVRSQLADERNELLLSAASSWEIAIKHQLGKLTLPSPPSTFVPERIRRSGVTPVPVDHAHALRVAAMPPHHRDPFDRLLVAQARQGGMAMVTLDSHVAQYDVEVIW